MRTVRIYGMAPNVVWVPPVPDTELWFCNDPIRGYRKTLPQARTEWTRWFNFHSLDHIRCAYARGYRWYQAQTDPTKRIVLQQIQADIPLSESFPREALLQFFGHRYFTFSAAWLIALAAYERFECIRLCGFHLSRTSPLYARQRACFFYWVEEAKRRGIKVIIPEEVGWDTPGDPFAYQGPLYGYETTCEYQHCRVCREKRFASMGLQLA